MRSQALTLLVALLLALLRVDPASSQAPPAAPATLTENPCTSRDPDQVAEVVRRRPGSESNTAPPEPCDPNRLPRVSAQQIADEPEAVSDRWQLAKGLGYRVDWLNSYQGDNPIKADRPIFGEDFFNFTALAGSLFEERRIPSTGAGVPDAGGARTATANSLFYNQSLSFDALLYRGDTIFRPPDWQWRFATVLSASGTHSAEDRTHADTAAIQTLFFEKHLRDVSVHDDFDSARFGIQSLTSDFRGFLLSDAPLAARLFGTRDSNALQYNLALFRSFRRNAVSLNDLSESLPHSDTLLANLYWQDFPRLGVTSEFVAAYNHSSEPGTQEILNGVDPGVAVPRVKHDYDVAYLGYGIDGHFGRLNTTAMAYGAFGNEKESTFATGPARIQAFFVASELSVDFDRTRWRLSLLHASGDGNPRDGTATGFNGLTASPVFAGTDSSFFIHQALDLSGGAFGLKSRNALLPTLNPGADSAEADFSNPGLDLLGLGLDWDLAPKWRVSADVNELRFDKTGVLSELLLKPVPNDFGTEIAVNAFWRPFLNQNLIVRMSNSMLLSGAGYHAIYDGGNPFSTFIFLTVTY
jgi:hypothetical protein